MVYVDSLPCTPNCAHTRKHHNVTLVGNKSHHFIDFRDLIVQLKKEEYNNLARKRFITEWMAAMAYSVLL